MNTKPKFDPKEFLSLIGETYQGKPKIEAMRIQQLELTRKILGEFKPKKLLDLGTRKGTIPFYLLKNDIIEEVVGIDRDPEAWGLFLHNARKLKLDKYAKFYPHDLNQKLPSSLFGQFDAIISFNTLYHHNPTRNFVKAERRSKYIKLITDKGNLVFYSGYGFPIDPDVTLSQTRDLIRDHGLIIISKPCLEPSESHEKCRWLQMLDTEFYCYEIRPIAYGLEHGLDYTIGHVVGRNYVPSDKEKPRWEKFQEHVKTFRQERAKAREHFNIKA